MNVRLVPNIRRHVGPTLPSVVPSSEWHAMQPRLSESVFPIAIVRGLLLLLHHDGRGLGQVDVAETGGERVEYMRLVNGEVNDAARRRAAREFEIVPQLELVHRRKFRQVDEHDLPSAESTACATPHGVVPAGPSSV